VDVELLSTVQEKPRDKRDRNLFFGALYLGAMLGYRLEKAIGRPFVSYG
jgi:hypothetical protein